MRQRFIFFSLLIFTAGSAWGATSKPLILENGSQAYTGLGPPIATLDDPLVVLSGAVKVTGARLMATLPIGMRPAQDMYFFHNRGTKTVQLEIKAGGQILMEGQAGSWVSLDGIAFTTRLAEKLALGPGVSNVGGNWGTPRAWKHYQLVMLSGTIVPGQQTLLTTLPPHLRPAERQIFGVRSEAGLARVDVLTNGQVKRMTKAGAWISLAGVTFPTVEGQKLQAGAGYHHYTDVLKGDFGKARALDMGEFTILSGLLYGKRSGEARIATLPGALRPTHRRRLNGFAGAGKPEDNAVARLDVFDDGRIELMEGGPKRGWVTLAGQVLVHGATTVAGPGPSPAPAPPSAPTLAQQTLDELKGLDWSLSPKLVTQLDRIAANAMTQEGTVFKATLTIAKQQVEVVIYRPAPGKQLEVAFLTDDLSVGNLIGALEGTTIDDFRVSKAAFIFVAKENARTATLNSLPAPVQQRLKDLSWSTFELVAGQNVVGRLHAQFSGTFADIVRETGICGSGSGCPVQVDVHANYGQRAAEGCRSASKKGKKGWRVRMTRPGVWQDFFGISGMNLTNATMEIAKENDQKLVRAWSKEAKIDNKSYFVFGQCVTKACKAQNAFAISAQSLSLQDYRTLMTKIASRVIGQNVGDWQGGLDRLPLNAVRVEHRSGYDPAQNVDAATGNPKFGTMLGYFVGPNQRVPNGDATCLSGTELYVNGKGVAFGAKVGELTAKWRRAKAGKKARIEADGQVDVPKSWSSVLSGGLVFAMRRAQNDHAMSLDGQFTVAGFGTPDVRLKADKQRLSWRSSSGCPSVMQVAIDAGLNITSGAPRISVEPDFNASCIQDAFNQVIQGAQAGVGIASENMQKGMTALGELGAAGVSVIEGCAREGWDTFNDKLEDGAKRAGKTLSKGAQSMVDGAKSVGSVFGL